MDYTYNRHAPTGYIYTDNGKIGGPGAIITFNGQQWAHNSIIITEMKTIGIVDLRLGTMMSIHVFDTLERIGVNMLAQLVEKTFKGQNLAAKDFIGIIWTSGSKPNQGVLTEIKPANAKSQFICRLKYDTENVMGVVLENSRSELELKCELDSY